MSGNHPNYSIIKIDQNTENSPGDVGRLAVSQISVEDHRLTMLEKILKEFSNKRNRTRENLEMAKKGKL